MPFLSDVELLRKRARQHIEEGAVTPNYGAHAPEVCKVLNDALATEIVCSLRYKRHYFMAQGMASESVKAEFLAHANEEQGHADEIANRIVQRGGEPDLDPAGLATRSHSQYVEGKTLREMIREDLVAERIAIESPARLLRGSMARIRQRASCRKASLPSKKSMPRTWHRCWRDSRNDGARTLERRDLVRTGEHPGGGATTAHCGTRRFRECDSTRRQPKWHAKDRWRNEHW